MQAWVTNDLEVGPDQPGEAPSAPAITTTHDPSQPSKIQSQPQPQPQPQPQQTRHVNILQARPTAARQTSPGRSRSPTINANPRRAAAAAAARISMPPRSSHGHSRDGSANNPRGRLAAADSLQQPKRTAPFWEGSTIEGSAFSDTASVNDSSAPFDQHQLPAQRQSGFAYQQQNDTHRRPVPRQLDRVDQPPSLVIGSNGLINMPGREIEDDLDEDALTPDGKNMRGGFRGTSSDFELGHYADDSANETSPEKTPSVRRTQHAKTVTIRPTKRENPPENIGRPVLHAPVLPQPPRPHIYPNSNPHRDEPTEVRRAQPEQQRPRPKVREHQPSRPVVFPDSTTPMVSRQDAPELASIMREPTPIPAVKPIAKAKPQVNRQLFTKADKGKAGLRESILPRSPERPQLLPKKRPPELDYDDGALAAMEYGALKEEAFDFDPAQAEAQSVSEPLRGTLPEKLEHFLGKDEAEQASFFHKMPVKDWEASGDWLLERFGDILDRVKEARREKRNIVNAYENEIAEREEAVRNKIHGIGQTLNELKSSGEGMMLGKGPK